MEHEEAKDRVAELRRQAFVHTDSDRRRSMAYEVGREGKFVAKGGNQGKAIAVFTSGGDAQGLTASIDYISEKLKHLIKSKCPLILLPRNSTSR